MKMVALTLSAIGLTVAISACNNAPNQTPPAAAAPGSNAADAPNNSTGAFSIKLIEQPAP